MDRKIKVRVGADMARRRVLAALAALAATPLVRPPSARAAAAFASEIAPGVYVHQGHHALFSPENGGDISNAGFIVGREAVAVVDTGGSAHVGAALRAAIRAVTDLPIRYVINTHMHPDHVFGNAAFADDAPAFVGHAKLARGLAARSERYLAINKELMGEAAFAGTRIILPTVVVEDRMTIDLGGRTLELEAEKTAHTDNDVIVRDTATGTVFLGDLLFSEHVPTLDGSIRGWLALMERLTAVPAQRVVPGHGPPSMPWPDAAKPLQRYLNTVATDVRRLIKENRTLSEATETAGLSEKDAWLLFEDYHKRNVSAAFAELEWE
jgi:quinoprotein relay system zinc metallohydrolase 2